MNFVLDLVSTLLESTTGRLRGVVEDIFPLRVKSSLLGKQEFFLDEMNPGIRVFLVE